MKCIKLKLIPVFVITVYFSCGVESQLTVSGVQCGLKTCGSGEYCSEFDGQCRPCMDICTKSHHNFEPKTCTRDCQDYLHDQHYVRKDGLSSEKDEDIRVVVQRLQYLVIVALTLGCITLLIVIVMVAIPICKWIKNNDITFDSLRRIFSTKKSDDNKTTDNRVVTMTTEISGKPDLRLQMPTTGNQSENSPVTLTTAISRRPAEDNTLDYAYDNHAMSNSPSPNSKPHESNF